MAPTLGGSAVTVPWSWEDTVGDVRKRVNDELEPGCVVEEREMLQAPFRVVYGEDFLLKGPADGEFMADVFFEVLNALLASSHGNNPDEVSVRMQAYKPLVTRTRGCAVLFPGQGTQRVGMVSPLLEGDDAHHTRALFKQASDILGYDLLDVCMNGPEDRLHSTQVSQPAVMVTSLAAVAHAQRCNPAALAGVKAAAGFSLGEYTALVFSGALSFEEGLKLVKIRAEAMQQATELNQGGMVSVVGLDDAALDQLCTDALRQPHPHNLPNPPHVSIANFLFPLGRVLSGDKWACEWIAQEAMRRGAKTAKPLFVSGAFHTPHMLSAQAALADALAKATLVLPKDCVVFSNVTGKPYTSVEEMRALLGQQVCSAVAWEATVREIGALGVERLVETGPGRQLKAMVKRIDERLFEGTDGLM